MKLLQVIASVALLGSAALAHALEVKPYSAEALAAAEQAGQPVAVHFHADWCPTCRAQVKTLQMLKEEKGLDVTVLTANYDSEKELKRRFNVRSQSTLVVLKGPKEVARLAGETSADGIRKALKAAL
ncbi:thioredoxin family protein [Acidovorax sp.]|uniref:thioredoxin family protein n=1 Tax=Acidovorax sp. TaxID=1872122 RepID=UPI002621E018|nr:thioredoxin family protein [Acidovorax sp.]